MAWLVTVCDAAAAAASRPTRIAIAPGGDGVRVDFDLPAAVTSLSLKLAEGPSPAANVRVEGEGFTFEDGQVTAARPFTRVSLIVTPDRREVDSVYPMMRAVGGSGSVLYAPYLLPISGPARMRVTSGNGATRTLRAEDLNGYVVVGATPEQHGGYRSLVSAGTPEIMRETMLGRARQLLSFYESRLRRPPHREPTIVISYGDRPAGSRSSLFRGDVTANGVVFLRVYSDGSQTDDPGAVARYTSFLAHELFHLWNRSRDPLSGNWWLHEGGAEYAAWIATATLWPGEPFLEDRVAGALGTCTMYLGARPMSGLSEVEARSVRYPCGAVMLWIVDVGARAHRSERDSFAVWARLLSTTRARGSYTPADFRAAVAELAPGAEAPLAAMLDGAGIDRWAGIARSLNEMGVRIDVEAPAPFLLRLSAARAIVLAACGEVHGVGENEQGLYVQAPESCAAFGDSPVVELAGGIAPMRDASAFYEAVRSRCAAGAEIDLSLRAGEAQRTHRVRCTVAVDPPPPDLKIVRALPVRGPDRSTLFRSRARPANI